MRKMFIFDEWIISTCLLAHISLLFFLIISFFIMPQEIYAQSEDDQISISCAGTRKHSTSVGNNYGDVKKEKIDLFLIIDDKKKILRKEDGSILFENCETWNEKIIRHKESSSMGFKTIILNRTNGKLLIESMKRMGAVWFTNSISATCEKANNKPMF